MQLERAKTKKKNRIYKTHMHTHNPHPLHRTAPHRTAPHRLCPRYWMMSMIKQTPASTHLAGGALVLRSAENTYVGPRCCVM